MPALARSQSRPQHRPSGRVPATAGQGRVAAWRGTSIQGPWGQHPQPAQAQSLPGRSESRAPRGGGLPVSGLPVSGLPCPAQGRSTAQGSREGSVLSDGQLCSYLTTWGSMEGVRPWPGERRVPPGCPAWALQEACPSAGRAGSAQKGHLSGGPRGHRVTAHKVLGPVEMV